MRAKMAKTAKMATVMETLITAVVTERAMGESGNHALIVKRRTMKLTVVSLGQGVNQLLHRMAKGT